MMNDDDGAPIFFLQHLPPTPVQACAGRHGDDCAQRGRSAGEHRQAFAAERSI